MHIDKKLRSNFPGSKKCSLSSFVQNCQHHEIKECENREQDFSIQSTNLILLPAETIYLIFRLVDTEWLTSLALSCQTLFRIFLVLKFEVRIKSWSTTSQFKELNRQSDTTFLYADAEECIVVSRKAFQKFSFSENEWETEYSLHLPMPAMFWTCTYLNKNLYVFGGYIEDIELKRMLILDGRSIKTVKPNEGSVVPCKRIYSSSCSFGDNIVIFGGQSEAFSEETVPRWFNDVHIYNTKLNTFEFIKTNGTPPHPRGAPTICCYKNKLLVFGGGKWDRYSRDALVGVDYFSDLFQLDTTTWTWEELKPKGELPGRRAGHAMCIVKDSLVITGGYETLENNYDYRCLSDCFILDLIDMKWTRSQDLAAPIGNHAMCYAPDRELIIISGGINVWDPYTYQKSMIYGSISEIAK
jgi:N-acetylneuraminic acid mutarotase